MPMNWGSTRHLFLGIAVTTLLTQPLHAETLSVCSGGGCDFSSIQAAIDAAADGDVIELSAETYLVDETLDTRGKAIRIVGSSDAKTGAPLTILDGQEAARVLQCISEEGPETVFEDLVIQNGYSQSHGGGMYSAEECSPTFANCTFRNNIAEDTGGGMRAFRGAPRLTDCRFTNNIARLGFGGGLINYQSSATLVGCTFTGNVAEAQQDGGGGGGMCNYESASTVDDCTFHNNAARFGGGMYNLEASPTITNCTFTNNSAYSDGEALGGGSGGGMSNLSSSSPTITGCTFAGNNAENAGGGMQIWGGNAMVVDCTFSNNSAEYSGGGIRTVTGEPTISGCTFSGNSADHGGAIRNSVYLSGSSTSPLITDCHFVDNSAQSSGGGVSNGDSAFPHITECAFSNNSAGESGGAVESDEDSRPTISTTRICQNTTDQITGEWTNLGNNCITESCGETACDSSLITVCASGCDFTAIAPAIESATPNDIIQLAAGTYLLDQAIDFHGLPATLQGVVDPATGAPLTILDGQGTHQVLRVTSNESFDTGFTDLMIRNGDADQGGGLLIENAGPTLTNCWFESNSALRGGGAFILSGTPTFTDCHIASNTAEDGAGAYLRTSQALFTRCEFVSNLASVHGGGFYARATGNEVTLIDCQVIDNQSGVNGGGGYVAGGRFDAVDTIFRGNQAKGDGGGLRLLFITDVLEDFTLTGCTLEANTGQSGGGAFIRNSDGHFTDCVIQGNSASLDGGGLAIENSTVALVQTSVCANSSDQVAGTVELDEASCVQAVCEDCASEPACPGDLDGDGDVGASDLTQLLADWGCSGAGCISDLDGSGTVGGPDLTIILSAWGDCG